ncbi:MAG: hypothetical protein HWD61_00040 [Parachlamydiaceae bacterium]|nr:MAG: hypothetical protein HWD61_00040 [Parachlamydiaceae bacterium]
MQNQLQHGKVCIDYFSQLKALAEQTHELLREDRKALNEAYPQMIQKLVHLLKEVKLDQEIASMPNKPIKADLLNASVVKAKNFNVKDWSFVLMGFLVEECICCYSKGLKLQQLKK